MDDNNDGTSRCARGIVAAFAVVLCFTGGLLTGGIVDLNLQYGFQATVMSITGLYSIIWVLPEPPAEEREQSLISRTKARSRFIALGFLTWMAGFFVVSGVIQDTLALSIIGAIIFLACLGYAGWWLDTTLTYPETLLP